MGRVKDAKKAAKGKKKEWKEVCKEVHGKSADRKGEDARG